MVDINRYGIVAFGATPSEIQLEHYKIGQKAMISFGVNTFSDKEWGDGSEREQLFDPSDLDTDQWIKAIKEAGFKLAIITAKHHDGFCLWPSEYTDHSVKNSPYKAGKGDVIKEFTDSCRKYGIKAGIYLSPWDRNSPFWGKDEYSDYYAKQLTELMTQYGEIYEVWWDGAGSGETRYDWGLWKSIVRKYQPKAAIFGSLGAAEYVDLRWVGNERGFAGETHYASIDPEYLLNETPAVLNVGQVGARKYIPSETDVSIRPGWFYHKYQDEMVKSPETISKIWFESIGRNSMMLLSFAPDRRGLIGDVDAENAKLSHQCISKMLSKNFVDDAKIICGSADEPFCVKDDTDGKEYTVYPGEEFEIKLPKAEKLNVFAVSELVEAGERVTEFTLESIDECGNTELLYKGTSIGFYKAVQFKEGMYDRLRFTVTDALNKPLLKNFGLHYFENIENAADKETEKTEENLVKRVESKNDGRTAVAEFDGIFAFNYIEFRAEKGSAYKVYAFNGLSYSEIASGTAQDETVKLGLSVAIDGSYQIMIEADVAVKNIRIVNKKLS